MTQARIREEYYHWLTNQVCTQSYSKQYSYDELLWVLHNTPFRYSLQMDQNRASDGVDLRSRFTYMQYGYLGLVDDDLRGPCSVLEMMIALAIRCEEDYMDDPSIGDRTSQWFWGMIVNLGLGSMTNDRFDEGYVDYVIERFLDRDYEPNGEGGLFTVKDCEVDLRKIEIWHQFCWYLDSIT